MNKKILGIVAAAAVVIIGGTLAFSRIKARGENIGSIEVTHDLGVTVLEKTPERVVVLDYGALDVLNSLDVNIVGVPQSGTLPEYLSEYSSSKYGNTGSVKEPDLEAINELNPDVIVMAGRMEDYYDELSEIAPTVYFSVEGGDYLTSFDKNLDMLGKVFGKEKETDKMVEEISAKLQEANKEITALNKNATTLILSGRKISAFSDKSRFGLIFNELGFAQADTALEESTHGQEVSFEYLVEKNPDYIFVVDRNSIISSSEATESAAEIIENELTKETTAYKNGNIVYLNSVNWYTVSGGYTSTLGMIDEVVNSIK